VATTNSLRIVCTTKSTHTSPIGRVHVHVVTVGVGTPEAYTGTYTVAQVRTMLVAGWTFYSASPSTQKLAYVEAFACCGIQTLRSARDAVQDNNLDNLPTCG
jgi:hypothetical protein